MWVSRSISGLSKCDRSPRPVRVGVMTVCCLVESNFATRFQHQPPCHAPCTRTNVVMSLSLRLLADPRNHSQGRGQLWSKGNPVATQFEVRRGGGNRVGAMIAM